MLVHCPSSHVLCGFGFEPHGGEPKGQRWIHWFVQLLTEPGDYVSYGFGFRIPNIRPQPPMPIDEPSWGRTPQDTIDVLRDEGLPLLAKYSTLEGLYELSTDFSIDLYMAHYWRYSTACLISLLLDLPSETVNCQLEQTRMCIGREPLDFEQEILDRCDRIELALYSTGRLGALKLMRGWEEWTASELQIGDMRDGSSWESLLGEGA